MLKIKIKKSFAHSTYPNASNIINQLNVNPCPYRETNYSIFT